MRYTLLHFCTQSQQVINYNLWYLLLFISFNCERWTWVITTVTISGFHHSVNEIFTLLGCYKVEIGSWSKTAWPLKMGPIGCPETSVTNYQSPLQKGSGKRSQYSDSLRAGRSSGGKIFRTRPDRPWVPPSLLYNGYRVIPWGKAAGAWRWSPTPI
jgi:hypothetical protein